MKIDELRLLFAVEAEKAATEPKPIDGWKAEAEAHEPELKLYKDDEPKVAMTREEIRRAKLECTTEGHDKEYRLTMFEESDGTYSLTASWGKRGKSLQSQEKRRGSRSTVASEYTKLIVEKQRKGYRVVDKWER